MWVDANASMSRECGTIATVELQPYGRHRNGVERLLQRDVKPRGQMGPIAKGRRLPERPFGFG